MVSKNVKMCLLSLIVRKMQITVIRKYHLTPLRMVYIQKTEHTSVGSNVLKYKLLFCPGKNVVWFSPYGK